MKAEPESVQWVLSEMLIHEIQGGTYTKTRADAQTEAQM